MTRHVRTTDVRLPSGVCLAAWSSLVLLGAGCASAPRRTPVPEPLVHAAVVPGIVDARIWGDCEPAFQDAWFSQSWDEILERYPAIAHREHHYLALSGGGPLGAFGAGLLGGWTERGDRPEFTMVTGVSAGGLTAPFAFLGPEYDAVLRRFFTQSSTRDVMKRRGPISILTGDAATDSTPLRSVLEKEVDSEVVQALAAEHRRGRLLLIGTTNLDAERPVIWNIGAIADSGRPGSHKLIIDILLASASIPGAFPPVYVDVEAEGERYDEMHVDGGTVSQIFVYPSGLEWGKVADKLNVKGQPKLYLVQNQYVDPGWEEVEPRTTTIAMRAMKTMIRTQGVGDLYRIYLNAERDGLDYHLAHIPASFQEEPKEPFDPEHMSHLYDIGFRMGKAGYPWKKVPPGWELTEERDDHEGLQP